MSVAGASFSPFQVNKGKKHSENITLRRTIYRVNLGAHKVFFDLISQVYKMKVCKVFVLGGAEQECSILQDW